MIYFAKVKKVAGRNYFVDFPELKGCMTWANTKKEAIELAHDALNGWVASQCKQGVKIPAPTRRRSKAFVAISVSDSNQAKIRKIA